MNLAKRAVAGSAILLARLGIIDETRGIRIADIAWPRVATGFAMRSQRTADFIMVGLAIGPTAIAGMGFAFAYWSIAIGMGFSLANSGMAFLSQRFGADDMTGMDLAFKQTLWIELVLASVFMVIFLGAAEPLISLLGASPAATRFGTIYLQIIVISIGFEVTNQLAARTLMAANDAWTPMIIRTGAALLNLVLNAIFIFGLGLGVAGAALGTLLSSVALCVVFAIGLLRGRLLFFGTLPVQIRITGPYFDASLFRNILTVGIPLMGRRLVSRGSQFFMLAIVAQFGTIVVAAYVASREIRGLMNTPGWGFGAAARSLVGQTLGANEEQEAMAFGWDILRFSITVHAVMAVIMIAFPNQIAGLFTNDPVAIGAMIPFITVMALSLIGLGMDSALSGILSAGADTRWPLYARVLGLYVFMIPLAYLGILIPTIGLIGLYLAITAETIIPAIVTYIRFNTGKWIGISRRYRDSAPVE